jgi:RNA 2',3'-cyclic 3'-phosphodiesterase
MRLFVAIDIDAAIRERIERFVEGVNGFAPDARWVKPETFHLTLKFLGETPGDRLAAINHALAGVQATAVGITFRGTGFFPTAKSARVFWIGIEADAHLAALAAAIEDSLHLLPELGIERDTQPYRPHLTLARTAGRSSGNPHQKAAKANPRFQRLQEKLAAMPQPDFGTMTAREFFLYESKLSAAGARYTKVARFALE